ncbi:MAG: GNAT family N-acetyltransferase [Coriobacteriia bacterium]|nr:GNAT family N-acetyltransferase [Coriobacteriia bacterium]
MVIRPLTQTDDPSGFTCGSSDLDHYLKRHALNNAAAGVSATYVFADDDRIRGYLTLAATTVRSGEVALTVNAPPYPLPALLVARLAVDSRSQGRGLGCRLLAYALEEAVVLHARVGCVAVLVDAKPAAESFYARVGFTPVRFASPDARHARMYLEIGTILDAIG